MRKLFSLFLALVATTSLWAHDFEVDGIYYNYLDGNNVEVTYRGYYTDSYYNEYAGEVIIPSTVTYNGTTYSVTSIGERAFLGCSSLTSITIPNSVTSIGYRAFYDCSSLTSPVYNAHCFAYLPTSFKGAYVIPEGIKQIAGGAFENCSSLTSITIGNSVTSIRVAAFSYCSSLTSITIGNSVTSIGDAVFMDCSSLTSVTIPNSVTSIGGSAFWNCSSFTSITCEATTPPTLGTNVFYGTKLSAVFIPDNTLSAYQTAWGNEYAFVNNETTLTLHVATPGTLADLIFDAGTRPVLVAKLTLTGTLNYADFTCMRETMTSLVDVDLSGITNTSGVNFNGKARLLRIILPTNLTSIGEDAFYGCSSLTSVTIGNSVTSIGEGAFYACSSLASVTIPNSVTSIGYYAFFGCSSLTSITIPNSVTSIGYRVFWRCSSLTSITIPNSVTSIGQGAFMYCSGLTSVTIPNSVTSIGYGAFYYCSSLDTLTCLAMTPPALEREVFYGCHNPTLFVPCAALSDYQLHEQWGQFTNIECISSEETDTEDVIIESGTTTVIITWPTEEGADTYSIVITKDGEVFCTLTFNSNGQLVSIVFAPGRRDNHPAQYAEATVNGYRFTVTGLEEGTKYAYNLDVKDSNNQTIQSYSGEFVTKSDASTSVSDIQSPITNSQKLLRDGQLIIIFDGVEYNAMGQEL